MGHRGNSRLAALAVGAAGAFALGAALGDRPEPDPGRAPRPARKGPAERARPAARPAVPDAVGEVTLISFGGSRTPAYVRRRLRSGDAAGVFLSPRNVASPAGLRAITRALPSSALVAVDQEGGSVRALPWIGPVLAQARAGSPAEVERAARDAGRGLRRIGVSVVLAPVADVGRPGSALAGRAYSGTPAEIGARVAAAVRGFRAGGVAATAKHFPGLGAAGANTDDAPVTVAGLGAADLAPFKAAVAARVPLVMVGHARYPAIDPARIASQSPAIVSDLLRRRLGFRGVVITDSLEARAVLARDSVVAAALASMRAGADLLLPTGPGSWLDIHEALLAEGRRSPAFAARLREAAARVRALRRALG
jgi:beta-N-acetylhexosaminidase